MNVNPFNRVRGPDDTSNDKNDGVGGGGGGFRQRQGVGGLMRLRDF